VLICVRPDQTISGELRKQWLQEIHPTACVRAIDDPGEDDNSELWAKYTVRILGIAPDVVFTSEDYGEAYAHFLGCRHVLVDRERTHVPVSARAIRTGPLSYWKYLEPCVRAYFAKRVSVLGAESTGTTTLVRHLPNTTARFGCQSTGATTARSCKPQVSICGLTSGAARSLRRLPTSSRKWKAREANRILICDTDVLATGIWHERYMGCRSPDVEAIAASHRHDLYLLTGCDLPFVQDGLRDGETIRQWMTKRFEDVLTECVLRWVKSQVAVTKDTPQPFPP